MGNIFKISHENWVYKPSTTTSLPNSNYFTSAKKNAGVKVV